MPFAARMMLRQRASLCARMTMSGTSARFGSMQ